VAVAAALACASALGFTANARAAYAPVDQPGPPLDVPVAKLQAAIKCSPNVGHSDREPVLLVPGTAATFKIQFEWNFAVALTKIGIPWCGVTPPQFQLGDIQTAAEYNVYAIRYLYRRSGRKIAVLGHSQGGMQPRWALRFWPDTRAMVEDQVGIAPDDRGVSLGGIVPAGRSLCNSVGDCPMTIYQQAVGSNFINALNSRQEMFPGIDYSVIYSQNDEIVNPPDSVLHGSGSYSRTALQDVCHGHFADHVLDGSVDPISWALSFDAITKPGPATAARLPPSVCSQLINPELDPATAATQATQVAVALAGDILQAPLSRGEPSLRCYVFATCTGAAAPTLQIWDVANPRDLRRGRRAAIHVLVRTDEGGALQPVPGATVRLAGHDFTTDDDGDTTIMFHPFHRGIYRLTASRAGCNPATATITIRR
jgi:hypothetical protein